MKRKLLLAAMTVFMVVACAVGFAACSDNGGTSVDGTYYLYVNDTLDKTQFITLDDKTWTDDEGETGEYSLSGSNITLYAELLGEQEEFASGTVKDGVLTLDIMGVHIVYCKEGATPPSDSGETPQEKYTVTYDANGGVFGNDETTFAQNDIPAGSLLTAPASPTRDGYSFAGWAKKKNGSELWMFDTDKVSGNTTLYAVWTQKSGIIVSVDGASIDGTNIFMLVDPSADSVSLSSKVICSDDSTWKLYYDKLGQVEIPTKIAAGQSGVLENGNNIFYIVVTSGDGTQVNTYQLTIHRSYAVDVRYYNGEEILKTESVYTGNKFTADYVPQIKGYTFNGWKTSDGEAFTEATVMGAFSLYADKTALSYEVTLDVNGGDELSKDTVTVTFDSSYSFPVPTREGYTFLGWYDEGTRLTDEDGESVYAWSYDLDMTVTAKWEANEYTVTLNRNDAEAGTVSGNGDYAYDSQVTITARTNDGYTWLGWYDENDELVSDKTTFTFKMGLDISYTAKWSKVTILKNIDGAGTVTPLDGKYNVGDEVTVTAETNLGYNFVGWFNEENKLTDKQSYTFTMSAENTAYTAKWEIQEELSNFIFTSTQTTCTISGIQDKSVTEIVVPDYVTSISLGAFSDCSSLESITLPFVGNVKDGTENTHFGYIFGASSYKNNSDAVPELLKTVIITNEKGLGERAFYECSSLTSITIPDSVTSIGDYAFYHCSSLTSITIPDSVTSIGDYAFCSCTSLTSVTIPDGVTSIGDYAFNDCASLANVTIPNGVTSIGDYAFGYCRSLVNISIPNGVTSIGKYAFYACHSLESITLPFVGAEKDGTENTHFGYIFGASSYQDSSRYVPESLKTVIITNGESIGTSAFRNCTSLANVIIPDGVTSIGERAFEDCSSLETITIPDSVTSIGLFAFRNCTSLANVIIPDSVTSIESSVFYGCSSLTSVTIPDSVTSIGSSAFSGCSSLTSVTIPDSVTSIGSSAFSGCKSLASVSIGNSVTSIEDYAFSGCSSLTNVSIGNSVTSIEDYAFSGCSSLTNVSIGNGVTSIGSSVFSGCSSLASITIPDCVTSIGYKAFSGCSLLESVTIGNGVTSIGSSAFSECSSLTNITIPDSVTSIGSSAFSSCRSLTLYCEAESKPTGWDSSWNANLHVVWNCNNNETADNGYIYAIIDGIRYALKDGMAMVAEQTTSLSGDLAIPKNVTYKDISYDVTSIGTSAFEGCTSLANVTIPDSVKSIGGSAFEGCTSLTSITIPDSVTSIEYDAFSGCKSLASVTIGNGVTSIGQFAFSGCTSLANITIPDSVTSIEDYAFRGCTSLENVAIGNGVTEIGQYAFDDCTSLESVTIGNGLERIFNGAFRGCTSLSNITFNGTKAEWNAIMKDSMWNYNTGNYTIHCTDGDISKS